MRRRAGLSNNLRARAVPIPTAQPIYRFADQACSFQRTLRMWFKRFAIKSVITLNICVFQSGRIAKGGICYCVKCSLDCGRSRFGICQKNKFFLNKNNHVNWSTLLPMYVYTLLMFLCKSNFNKNFLEMFLFWSHKENKSRTKLAIAECRLLWNKKGEFTNGRPSFNDR